MAHGIGCLLSVGRFSSLSWTSTSLHDFNVLLHLRVPVGTLVYEMLQVVISHLVGLIEDLVPTGRLLDNWQCCCRRALSQYLLLLECVILSLRGRLVPPRTANHGMLFIPS